MRFVGIILLAAFGLTLVVGAVCCADAGDCDGFCPCVCCGHGGFCIDPSTGADTALMTQPVRAPDSPLAVSLCVSPELPPPRV